VIGMAFSEGVDIMTTRMNTLVRCCHRLYKLITPKLYCINSSLEALEDLIRDQHVSTTISSEQH
jgi:hypothetical protein